MSDNLAAKPVSPELEAQAERIYRLWDQYWSADDLDAMIGLYAEDATIESPLVPHLNGGSNGRLEGKAAIKALLAKAAPRKPGARHFHRIGYFTDGALLMWEYPRATPAHGSTPGHGTNGGEQMDFVEVMEIRDGLIQHHRVYWGWRGVEVIKADAYYKDR
ncbi:MAG TPA: nuclear transport factor 2 family protein [Terriglobia bacterium]|nr:nuclear transport factor 2 family protein [Terriglobia bacterium]